MGMVEAPGVIGVEAVTTETVLLPGGGIFGQPDGPTLNLHYYEFLVLRGGAIRCCVSGLITPRPDGVEAPIAQAAEQIRQGQQIAHDAKRRAAAIARKNAEQIGWPRR